MAEDTYKRSLNSNNQDYIFRQLLNQATTHSFVKDKSSTSPPSSQTSSMMSSFTSAATVNMLLIQAQQQVVSLSETDSIPLTIQHQIRALQDTLLQLQLRFESNALTLKQYLNEDSSFKVEVVSHWGKLQNFIDSFTQNHTQLMEFIIGLYKKTLPKTKLQAEQKVQKHQKSQNHVKDEQEDQLFNSLEEQILKSLNIKQEQSQEEQKLKAVSANQQRIGKNTAYINEGENIDSEGSGMKLQEKRGSLQDSDSPKKQSESVKQQAEVKKKKNLFGLDFEIPDELQQLIAMEMKSKQKNLSATSARQQVIQQLTKQQPASNNSAQTNSRSNKVANGKGDSTKVSNQVTTTVSKSDYLNEKQTQFTKGQLSNPSHDLEKKTILPMDSREQLQHPHELMQDSEGNLFGYQSPSVNEFKQTESMKNLTKDSQSKNENLTSSIILKPEGKKSTAETPAFGQGKDRGFFKEFQSPNISQFSVHHKKQQILPKSSTQRQLDQEIKRSLSNSKQASIQNRVESVQKHLPQNQALMHKTQQLTNSSITRPVLKQSLVSDFNPSQRMEVITMSRTPPNRTSVQTLSSISGLQSQTQQTAFGTSRVVGNIQSGRSNSAVKSLQQTPKDQLNQQIHLAQQRPGTSSNPQFLKVTAVQQQSQKRNQSNQSRSPQTRLKSQNQEQTNNLQQKRGTQPSGRSSALGGI